MRIGFDAKRAYKNRSGLGNYSRTVIEILEENYPNEEYILYTPTENKVFPFKTDKQRVVSPKSLFFKKFHFVWRTYGITKELEKDEVDLYHGLSHELPKGIENTNTKSIVTVHDLIFVRFPHLFNRLDVNIYKNKLKYACSIADKVIAISEQTKQDLIDYINLDESKIELVYQGCDNQFLNQKSDEEKQRIKQKYNLPEEYLLYVGTIEERKNSLQILKAVKSVGIDIPIVIVGRKTDYYEKLEKFISENGMEKQVYFYHNAEFIDFPSIYQMAKLFVYPSIFEGFGIPILEAINSRVPVITSKGSCFKETGGEHSIYVDHDDTEALAQAIQQVISDQNLRKMMVENSLEHAKMFTDEKVAARLMEVYKSVVE